MDIQKWFWIIAPHPPSISLKSSLGFPKQYTASKSSIIGITKHFAVTAALSKKGRCNCIVLGGLEDDSQSSQFQENYISKVPKGRMAYIDDVLNAYQFLSSDKSTYITGISLFVDGGYSCW